MDVVRHNHELIEKNLRPDFLGPQPLLLRDSTEVAEQNPTIVEAAKEWLTLESVDSDEIATG
ncbi:MAG: hypothetical protein ACJ8BF_11565 [Gemmatimonadales bacterium]